MTTDEAAVAQPVEHQATESLKVAGSIPAGGATQILRLTLPYGPSTNTYWRSVVLPKQRHTVLISERGREYRKEVAVACAGATVKAWAGANWGQPLAIHVLAYPPDVRKRDLDNLWKALLDSLKHAQVFRDDSDIWDERITRACISAPPGRLVVKLQRFDLGELA